MNMATIGIDFGTTTSSMAWVDPGTGKAEMLKNAEGEEKTPSVVYFGADQVLVGTPAEQMLEDPEEGRRVVASVKRELVNAPTLALPGRRVKAVEVAAAVFAKLKRDAEELHFQEPVTRAVITCPASFDVMEREAIEAAARLAGFTEVRTLEEPVAAALAYSRAGLGVGRHVLVYDLGGGTFDLALLREEAGGFALALEPKGLRRCGGDDFDQALYDYCDEEAERQWGVPLHSQGRDLRFLRDCRRRKENLSAQDKVLFSSLVGEGRLFRHSLTRELFEGLISSRIDTTVRLTGELVRAAEAQGFPVETVVLIGGSSRIPLVQRRLKESLSVEPRRWQHQDVAVALGAAYFAQELWPLRAVPGVTQDRHELDILFFVTHPEAGQAFMRAISHSYPCSEAMIGHYTERWDWSRLSSNESLPWSERLIERFAERWVWGGSFPYKGLSSNPALPWSETLIERYAERWEWGGFGLSRNPAIPWSEALIERYTERWDWGLLSSNESLPWSEALIERYANRWQWGCMLSKIGLGLSSNKSLPWCDTLIARYVARWNWSFLSINHALPWSEALIEQFAERWQWNGIGLNENPGLPWSEALIERYAERWNWGDKDGLGLHNNPALPWSEALIERYADRWDWNWLADNHALPWSETLIERYADRWEWGGYGLRGCERFNSCAMVATHSHQS